MIKKGYRKVKTFDGLLKKGYTSRQKKNAKKVSMKHLKHNIHRERENNEDIVNEEQEEL